MACGRQKVKGGNGSITASISTSIIASIIASVIASIITLNLGVGCAPSCWPIFGFRNLLGARRGAEGSFLCSLSNRFSGRGGGVGSLPRAWRRVGVPGAQQVLKKFVRLASAFPSPPTRSLSNRKGRGRRSGGRAREPRRAGEG